MAARKTFVWLSGRKRPPSEYEELSTGIQWNGLPVSKTTVGQWSEDSTELSTDWNAFRDPGGMYYRNYVVGQDAVEKQLDAAFALTSDADFISAIDPEWRESLKVTVGTMSFVQWGSSMALQHVLRFTLSPTVACAVQLQIMDKLRAAERSVQWFELLNPELSVDDLHGLWDEVPEIQPLHRFIEEILVEKDWGKVLVAVNLVLGGLLEPFLRELYVPGGRAYGDFATSALGTHLAKDAKRAVVWTDAFLAQCMAEEANATVIAGWVDHYLPAAAAAIDAIVAAHPAGNVAKRARNVASGELHGRLSTLNVKLSDDVVAALESGTDPTSV
ncbi:MAG: hypothetical protein ACT4QF_06630 [Sporichthyaceae bacterium]